MQKYNIFLQVMSNLRYFMFKMREIMHFVHKITHFQHFPPLKSKFF